MASVYPTLFSAFSNDSASPYTTLTRRPLTPNLEIILVIGDANAAIQYACRRFARDFGFCHFNVADCLHDLASSATAAAEAGALNSLHPHVLRETLAAGGAVDPYFLVQILKWRIDREVASGCAKFLMCGFADDERVTSAFWTKIAVPSAVIRFTQAKDRADRDQETSHVRGVLHSGADQLGDPITLGIIVSAACSAGKVYERALRAMAAKAGVSSRQ